MGIITINLECRVLRSRGYFPKNESKGTTQNNDPLAENIVAFDRCAEPGPFFRFSNPHHLVLFLHLRTFVRGA